MLKSVPALLAACVLAGCASAPSPQPLTADQFVRTFFEVCAPLDVNVVIVRARALGFEEVDLRTTSRRAWRRGTRERGDTLGWRSEVPICGATMHGVPVAEVRAALNAALASQNIVSRDAGSEPVETTLIRSGAQVHAVGFAVVPDEQGRPSAALFRRLVPPSPARN